MKKKKKIIILCCLLMAAFLISPLAPRVLSLGVMSVYSHMEEKESLMADRNIKIEIPSAEGWYPFVMTFNADSGFRAFTGDSSIRLSIMYNFPDFDPLKGCSRIYDEDSPYYSSFYGAYCVSGDYGFDGTGSLDPEATASVPEYDMTYLVLRDLGMDLKDIVFEWKAEKYDERYTVAGYGGWQRADAEIRVNGLAHRAGGYLRNYIQYGKPGYEAGGDFEPVSMSGRVYGKYFPEKDCGIFFYIISSDESLTEDWEKEILAKSSIKFSGGA